MEPVQQPQRLTVIFIFEGDDRQKCKAVVFPMARSVYVGAVMMKEATPEPLDDDQIPDNLKQALAPKGFISTIMQSVVLAGYDVLMCDKDKDGQLILH